MSEMTLEEAMAQRDRTRRIEAVSIYMLEIVTGVAKGRNTASMQKLAKAVLAFVEDTRVHETLAQVDERLQESEAAGG